MREVAIITGSGAEVLQIKHVFLAGQRQHVTYQSATAIMSMCRSQLGIFVLDVEDRLMDIWGATGITTVPLNHVQIVMVMELFQVQEHVEHVMDMEQSHKQ